MSTYLCIHTHEHTHTCTPIFTFFFFFAPLSLTLALTLLLTHLHTPSHKLVQSPITSPSLTLTCSSSKTLIIRLALPINSSLPISLSPSLPPSLTLVSLNIFHFLDTYSCTLPHSSAHSLIHLLTLSSLPLH